jgi:hypothetical protein
MAGVILGFSSPGRPSYTSVHAMSAYFFRVSNGCYPNPSDLGAEFANRDAAWAEMTGVCGDIIGDISRKLGENGAWQIELLDEFSKPVFRIRLVAETLDSSVFARVDSGLRQDNASN